MTDTPVWTVMRTFPDPAHTDGRTATEILPWMFLSKADAEEALMSNPKLAGWEARELGDTPWADAKEQALQKLRLNALIMSHVAKMRENAGH